MATKKKESQNGRFFTSFGIRWRGGEQEKSRRTEGIKICDGEVPPVQ